jgi:HD superfamily phosphohydrolase
MLNEVIKQTQKTISLLIQDINHITTKLNEYILAHGTHDAQIKKLMLLMTQMTGAGSVLTEKSNTAQSSATKLRCAQYLDESKLKSLTREPTKADLYDFIVNFYEEKAFKEEKDGETREITKLVIKKNQPINDLENLAKAFEAVGYFNMTDVLKGTAADAAGKAKEKLSSLFS